MCFTSEICVRFLLWDGSNLYFNNVLDGPLPSVFQMFTLYEFLYNLQATTAFPEEWGQVYKVDLLYICLFFIKIQWDHEPTNSRASSLVRIFLDLQKNKWSQFVSSNSLKLSVFWQILTLPIDLYPFFPPQQIFPPLILMHMTNWKLYLTQICRRCFASL